MKPRIFIGSSSESKDIASYVCSCLGSDYECVIWSDNFFELNINTYENLIKNAIAFDYAIYIGNTKILEIAKRKEVDNFVLTLTRLLKTTPHINSITTIKRVSL